MEQRISKENGRRQSALSGSTLLLAFAALLAVGGLIVLVGWLITRPPAPPHSAPMPEPSAEITPPPAPQQKPIPIDESPSERPLRETIQLPRRMPSRAEEHGLPVVAAPAPAKPAAPIDPREDRPRVPLQWTVQKSEPLSRPEEMSLILPVEVAKIEDPHIPFSVRRLRFPEGAAKQLHLAVTPAVYDDMAGLLTKMGVGYSFSTISNEDTCFFDKIKSYDVLFLTCAEVKPQDLRATAALRKYVETGGTLYASDLRVDMLLAAFPEFRARNPILPGIQENIDASVIDKGLQVYLGRKTVPLNFDSAGWRPAGFDSNKVTVCLRGVYRNNLGQPFTVPLMVKFRVKRGTVIFTSFHNSKNDSEVVRKVLEYLVFSAVNARSETRVKELMAHSQFAPRDQRPVLVSANRTTEATYQHNGGGLQIALGFENVGAKLKLTLLSPRGQKIEHEERGLFLIEVPRAEPGEWRYRIAPVELPYPSFPVVVAVGMLKSSPPGP